MSAPLLGSYSILTTFPTISLLSLLKSISRKYLLCRPPLCLTLILPLASRPALYFMMEKSDFSLDMFSFFIFLCYRKKVYFLSCFKGDNCFFPVRCFFLHPCFSRSFSFSSYNNS